MLRFKAALVVNFIETLRNSLHKYQIKSKNFDDNLESQNCSGSSRIYNL